MEELTESARQCLVSQGIILGTFSVLNSLGLFLKGIVVLTRANDLLHFTSLTHLAILEIICGITSLLAVGYIWWMIAAYRNRQLEIRSKYLDETISRGLLTLILPLFLNFAAFIVSAIFMLLKAEATSTYDFKSAMASYSTDINRKVILDKLQILLRCCGSQSLLDWFLVDWQNLDVEPGVHFENGSSTDWDSVPFSCCCPEAPPPCVHHQLRIFGVGSLYTAGCSDKLDEVVFVFVVISLIMFFLATVLMIILMYTSRKLQTSARSAVLKGDATAPGTWWLVSPAASQVCQVSTDQTPLLEPKKKPCRHSKEFNKESTSMADYWCKHNKVIMTPVVVKQKPFQNTGNEDWQTYNGVTTHSKYGQDAESSEEWTRKACDASGSTSTTSFMTTSNAANSTPESRRSVSDTAVANLEVSHHFEHKIRPLYRT